MNVLQILPELNIGGVETGTLDLARHLVRLGHKSVVVSCGGRLVKDLQAEGSRHYALPVHKKSMFTMARMVPKLTEIIRKEKIDIVHARSRVPAWIAYFACRRTPGIFITTCHGYYKKRFFSRVMGWGKVVICPSRAVARYMIDNFNISPQKIRVIARSVDLQRFKFVSPDKKRRDTITVGIVGRITPLKGHLCFIQAMAKVIRTYPNLKIWIVGDAPASKAAYKEEVQMLVRRLGLSHCTEFLGIQQDIPAVMSNLDILVLASTYPESFGRVIIEANAAGVAVVAARVGGVVDIVDDEATGLLVPVQDPKAMSEAILRLIKDAALSARLAKNAYNKLKQNFTLPVMADNTLNAYKYALSHYNILVIKFGSLGDVVLSTAALRAIRERFSQGYKISLLVGDDSKDIVGRCPYIDELIIFNLKDKTLRAVYRMGRQLRRRDFDIVVDLQNNRLSHLLAWLSLAKDRYGYHKGRFAFLLNHRIKDTKEVVDPIAHQFRALKMLDIELREPRLQVWLTKQDEEFIDGFLRANWAGENTSLVGINITASLRWQTKVWPEERIVELCEQLAEKGIRVVLTGKKEDLQHKRSLVEAIGKTRPINACGKTNVNQLACLIKRCRVFITCDSAPLHLACAVGVPYIALFGPTDWRRHVALGGNKGIVINKNLLCSPCYKPKCRSNECMKKITAQEVLKAIDKLLE